MENKKLNILKIISTIICAVLAFGALVFVLLKGDIKYHILTIISVGICFLFSLLFLRLTAKTILLTTALAANTLAMAFAIFDPTILNGLLDTSLLLAMEACFVVYTLWIIKGVGMRIISLAVRVGLCMLAYFVLPNYAALTTKDILTIFLMINQVVTIAILALNFKREWLTLLGVIVLFVSTLFAWLASGGIDIFGTTGQFIEFLFRQDWEYIFRVPALFVIALSSVWIKNKQN